MRYIDTNIFISALVEPEDDLERRKSRDCIALFNRVMAGEERARTHDAIIAEVAYFLSRSRQYRLPAPVAATRIRTLVVLADLLLPNKRTVLRALDVWSMFSKLDFEDALSVAYAEDDNAEIYSYDHDFDRVPGVERVEPE